MKLSEVSINDLKQYANVYTEDDDNLFSIILAATKGYITSYTGLPLERITTVPVVNPIQIGSFTITGTSISGYTVTVTFSDNSTVSVVAQSDNTWSVNVPITVTLNEGDQVSVIHSSPLGNVSAPTVVKLNKNPITQPSCADDFEDITIALKVLSNEMYDNRAITVDNDKLNFVVKQILDSHSVNLL